MSTINKTFLRVLLAIACCIALAFSLLPQAEAAMRADVVTGNPYQTLISLYLRDCAETCRQIPTPRQ